MELVVLSHAVGSCVLCVGLCLLRSTWCERVEEGEEGVGLALKKGKKRLRLPSLAACIKDSFRKGHLKGRGPPHRPRGRALAL
eukprot:235501-Pelagomonas_calceolata.AAC.1